MVLIDNQQPVKDLPAEDTDHPFADRVRSQSAPAAPLKPLPEPVDLGQYRVRKRARVDGPINEYRLVA
jgi:hypothetical protein